MREGFSSHKTCSKESHGLPCNLEESVALNTKVGLSDSDSQGCHNHAYIQGTHARVPRISMNWTTTPETYVE